MLEYWPLIKRRFRRQLRQVVLYVGQIREIEAEALIKTGNHGDLALAVLAGGGGARLGDILRKAAAVKDTRRDWLLAKILILSGLRGVAGRVELELKRMGVVIDVTKNPVLMRWSREFHVEGMHQVLHVQLETKFGPLPKWAGDRMSKVTPSQIERWAKKVLTADTLEAVLGKK